MIDIFNNFYKGKRVLITGHTGFKGSWLSIWLHALGAEVIGISLPPYTQKDNYVLSTIGDKIKADIRADIRDYKLIKEIFIKYQPEIVFHLAAQPLVRISYNIPIETYETNLMGTINILEAIRNTNSVKVGVMITTDKCYENNEQERGYKETDAMGGYDPYSSSKGACEIAISSWRRSFFNPQDYGKTHNTSISSVRAGNVIGGGDWALDRIIPDCIRSLENNEPIIIRSPDAVRPWEHVLEPISGYLLLAMKQWESPTRYCEAWNFGPENTSICTVKDVVNEVVRQYGKGEIIERINPNNPHEAKLLLLNIDKVKTELKWKPRMNIYQCIELVIDWYKNYRTKDVYQLCVDEINKFLSY